MGRKSKKNVSLKPTLHLISSTALSQGKEELRDKVNCAIGSAILYLRTQHNVDQQELGKVIGVHQTAVSRIESGVQSTSPDQLLVLSQFFNVPVQALILGDVFKDPLLGRRISFYRQKLKLTVEYVANCLGLSVARYNLVEKGRYPIDHDKLGQLSRLLKVDRRRLLSGEPKLYRYVRISVFDDANSKTPKTRAKSAQAKSRTYGLKKAA